MWRDLMPAIVAALLGGGFFAGIVALIKLRPESGQIVVTAAQGALVVQTGVIDSLNRQLEASRARITELESENLKLRLRVAKLERELHKLQVDIGDTPPEGVR